MIFKGVECFNDGKCFPGSSSPVQNHGISIPGNTVKRNGRRSRSG